MLVTIFKKKDMVAEQSERKRLGEGKRQRVRGDRCFQYALRNVGPDFERRGYWGSLVTWHSGTTLEKIKP